MKGHTAMLVRDCMTRNPISVRPESDPLAAVALCKSARIRRLPVIDAQGHIVGIVSRNDLELFLSKAPSPGVMKRQHNIKQVMVTRVATVSPDLPMEEAARLMVERKVGSLPVVEDGKLVGIITETDIFKQFVDILGGQADAIRITVMVKDVCGELAKVVNAVVGLGCNIRSIVIHDSAQPGYAHVTLWVLGAEQTALTATMQNIPDVRLIQVWSK
jgi:acetoin utilization protein AcuB